MTPTDEATFIALWQQGLSQDAIAQQLGIPVGTVKSRAHTLAHAGKLTPRPRGGAYPRQQALARQEGRDPGVHQCRDQCSSRHRCSADSRHRCSAFRHWSSAAARSARRRGAGSPPARPSPWSIASTIHQCRHRCRSRHCPPIPREGRALEPVDPRRHEGADQHPRRRTGPLAEELVQEYLWKALNDQSPSRP